jgi:hypothetical protein
LTEVWLERKVVDVGRIASIVMIDDGGDEEEEEESRP